MARFSPGKWVAAIGMTGAFTVVGGVSLALIAEKVVTPELGSQLLCTAGLVEFAGDSCIGDRIEEAQARLRRDLDTANAGLSGRMVFTEGPKVASLTVIVGTIYRDHATRSDIMRAICWGIQDRGGLDPRLTLAEMDGDGTVRALAVDAFERSAINLDPADVAAARRVCPWPDPR